MDLSCEAGAASLGIRPGPCSKPAVRFQLSCSIMSPMPLRLCPPVAHGEQLAWPLVMYLCRCNFCCGADISKCKFHGVPHQAHQSALC